MASQYEDLIREAYSAFNARDIDTALSTMHPEVQWPKAFEGGYINGHSAVREYWTRQWILSAAANGHGGFASRSLRVKTTH